MAINPTITYPGKILPASTEYPYGEPTNVNINGDGTGTPWEGQYIKDDYGFKQAILSQADYVPTNLPDTTTHSQYLDGLKKIILGGGYRVFDTTEELLVADIVDGSYVTVKELSYVPLEIKTVGYVAEDGDLPLATGQVAAIQLQAINDVRWWGAVPDFVFGSTRAEDTGTDNVQAFNSAIIRLATVGHATGFSAFDVDEKVLSLGGCSYGLANTIYIIGGKHGIKLIDGLIAALPSWNQGFSDKALFIIGEAGNQGWLFNFNNITFNARKRTNGVLFGGTQKSGCLYCNASEFIDFGFSTLNTNGELKLTNCSSYELSYQEGLTVTYASLTGAGFWMRSADFILTGCVGAVSQHGLRLTGGYNYQVIGCHFWLGVFTDSPLGNVPAVFIDEGSHSGMFSNLYVDFGIVEMRGSFDHLFNGVVAVGAINRVFKLVAIVADEDASGLLIDNIRVPVNFGQGAIAYTTEGVGTWGSIKKHIVGPVVDTEGNSNDNMYPHQRLFVNKEGGIVTNTSDVTDRDIIPITDMNPSIHAIGNSYRRLIASTSFSTFKGAYAGFITAVCASGDETDFSVQPTSGDFLGQYWSTASNGSDFGNSGKPFHGGGGMRVRASETWTPTDQGTDLRLYGTVKGTNTPVPFLYIDEGGFSSRADTLVSLGTPAGRWSEVYAVNGTINTSDERLKEQQGVIPDEVLDVWATVEKKRYKWSDSVAAKEDKARWHVGVMAQDIQRAFEAAGLNPFEWAVLCFDTWEEQVTEHPAICTEVKDSDGNTIKEEVIKVDGTVSYEDKMKVTKPAYTETIPAGDRYGVRYEQAAQFDAALERRERLKLEAKIDLLLLG